MKVIKNETQFGMIILFEEENKILSFTFGGNGDLYWSIYIKNGDEDKTFVITKENYGVYMLFEQLFRDIENINIFDIDNGLFDNKIEKIEVEKDRYRLFNCSNYNELYDKDNKMITWYSDETANKVANILKIKKREDVFILEFCIQPYVDGYDYDFHYNNYVPIRFRNSGSLYDPFNIVFMRMYNKMKELDDVNDVGHQVHIGEYLYNKEKKLKMNRRDSYSIGRLD